MSAGEYAALAIWTALTAVQIVYMCKRISVLEDMVLELSYAAIRAKNEGNKDG